MNQTIQKYDPLNIPDPEPRLPFQGCAAPLDLTPVDLLDVGVVNKDGGFVIDSTSARIVLPTPLENETRVLKAVVAKLQTLNSLPTQVVTDKISSKTRDKMVKFGYPELTAKDSNGAYDLCMERLYIYRDTVHDLYQLMYLVSTNPGVRTPNPVDLHFAVTEINKAYRNLDAILDQGYKLFRFLASGSIKTQEQSTNLYKRNEALADVYSESKDFLGAAHGHLLDSAMVNKTHTYAEVAARSVFRPYTNFLMTKGWDGFTLPDSRAQAEDKGLILQTQADVSNFNKYVQAVMVADKERQIRADANAAKPLEWKSFTLSPVDANGKTGFILDPRDETKAPFVRPFRFVQETPLDDTTTMMFPMFLVTSPAQVAWTLYQVRRIYGVNLVAMWWADFRVWWRGPLPG